MAPSLVQVLKGLIRAQQLSVCIRLNDGSTKRAPAFTVFEEGTRLVVAADDVAFGIPSFEPDLPEPRPKGTL
jgi:hypothetical protein